MNNKNNRFERHPGRNGQADFGKEENVEALIDALETDERATDTLDSELQEVHRIGVAIKQIAKEDLPEASAELRNRLLAELGESDGKLLLPIKDEPKNVSRWFSVSRFALAACLLVGVAIGVVLFLNQKLQKNSRRFSRIASISTAESAADDVRTINWADSPDSVMPAESADPQAALVDLKKEESNHSEAQAELSGESLLYKNPQVSVSDRPVEIFSNGQVQSGDLFTFYSANRAASGSVVAAPQTGGVGWYFEGDGKQTEFYRLGNWNSHNRSRPEIHSFALVDESLLDDQALVNGEQYGRIIENEFIKVKSQDALSTFSIDVDTASYSNLRRFLNSHQFPPRDSVRIEELVNYFKYDYPQPQGADPFSVNMELASCPWNESHHLLRVGLKGKEVHRDERSPTNLVFLLDVSGSMQSQDKLPLLKQGVLMMIQQLSENDSVSIVTYAGNAGLALPPTHGENKLQIEKAINSLNAGGSTNGSAGINLAYEIAQKQFIKNGTNRVILATDGDLNVGVTSDQALVKLIKEKASEGVFLTVLGFGTGNLKDEKLEKLADNGNGIYAYIDSQREAHKVLIEQMSGSLETIAKDVKIQIEFNPSEVSSYRLIGYENRMLAAKDFDDDRKDAGDIGAGHTVTALYELELADSESSSTITTQQALKYQDSKENVAAKTSVEDKGHSGEVLTLSLRYKQPDENQSRKIQFVLKNEPVSFSSASTDFQFASAVASFGMILRHSPFRGSASLDWVAATASKNLGKSSDQYRVEFLDLVRKAKSFAN